MAANKKQRASSPFAHSHAEVDGQKYVIFADSKRRYVDCSDGVCELLGYSKAEILSKRIDDLSYITTEVPAIFERFVKAGEMDGHYLLAHKNGQPVSISYQAWAFADGCLAAVWKPAELWLQLYHAALLEVQPERLEAMCKLALEEIDRYTRECDANGSDSAELSSQLVQAARTLRVLLNE
jgi:PAS domain-containing protein